MITMNIPVNKHKIPWNWSYEWVVMGLGLLKEQQVVLTTDLSLQPKPGGP